jgi:hypothetical protein
MANLVRVKEWLVDVDYHGTQLHSHPPQLTYTESGNDDSKERRGIIL